MESAKRLKEKINREEVTVGVLATDQVWPMLVEVCLRAELDYLIIDREHGPHDDSLVAQACQTARLAGFPALIRTVSTESDVIRRALDLGPCGLMFPSVESADVLDQAAESIYLPPRGRRRPGGWGNYWMPDYQYETWRHQFEDDLIVLAQIETVSGLENVEAIARHDLVTALAIGPYDLSASMGCCWNPDNPDFQAALRRIRDAGKAAGKNTWMGMGARALVEDGWTFICLGTPSFLLQNAARQMAAEARGAAFGDSPSEDRENCPA